MIRILILSFSVLMLAQCQPKVTETPEVSAEEPARPKNVILLIGDGMGVTQVTSQFYFGEGEPNFTRFPYIGLIKTSSSSDKITDSAAGGTALSVGQKTYNGAIAVADDSSILETIVELVSDELSTGLIATSSIVHATPASFYAHVPSRNQYEDIAAQLTASSVDFFAGGGIQFFANREDGANYLDSLAANGFVVDTTQLRKPANLSMERKYGFLLAPDGMPKMQEGRGDFLPQSTEMALDYLAQDEDGFFLMVESSQIDWGGHANDAEYIIEEMKDFDKTVGVALDFAERDGNTLVVVTADHETGGFALSAGETYDDLVGTFSTGGHTPDLIPVFAYGPGAEAFAGIYENTGIYDRMVEAIGWEQDGSTVASR
ncbi:MAG: alkaline phosphatase [Bacteroidota bacterium]